IIWSNGALALEILYEKTQRRVTPSATGDTANYHSFYGCRDAAIHSRRMAIHAERLYNFTPFIYNIYRM
ncbi:MAG: hypothetical protein Q4D04_14925, partial [Clostridia bacterium]|nr:hypothetical protein [Clostridia bacterium]